MSVFEHPEYAGHERVVFWHDQGVGLQAITAIHRLRGGLRGIEAAVRFRLGRDTLRGLTVAVQGVGAVGGLLCRHLHDAGARLILADIDRAAADALAVELGADVVGTDEILFAAADVVAPCALGAILDDDSIPRIRAAIVCGGANNLLKEPHHARLLHERGILFAPDYVVNCGGTLGGAAQAGMFSADQLESRIARIDDTTLRIFELAAKQQVRPDAAAQSLAEELLAQPHGQ